MWVFLYVFKNSHISTLNCQDWRVVVFDQHYDFRRCIGVALASHIQRWTHTAWCELSYIVKDEPEIRVVKKDAINHKKLLINRGIYTAAEYRGEIPLEQTMSVKILAPGRAYDCNGIDIVCNKDQVQIRFGPAQLKICRSDPTCTNFHIIDLRPDIPDKFAIRRRKNRT